MKKFDYDNYLEEFNFWTKYCNDKCCEQENFEKECYNEKSFPQSVQIIKIQKKKRSLFQKLKNVFRNKKIKKK